MTKLEQLERRVEQLEQKERVKRAMARVGRWMDRCELTKDTTDIEFLANELMTEQGTVVTMFGTFGPSKTQFVEGFKDFAAEITWAVHHYYHQEVDVDLDAGTAHFHALEMVPLQWKQGATWLLLENDSTLHLLENEWKVHRYSIDELKTLGNAEKVWHEIPENPNSRMFSHP
tara:strand:- start:70 stop:588 length:519 start_codon:yes stop_codon:yes gene_type:complete